MIMNKLELLAAIIPVILIFQACKSNTKPGSITKADSVNSMKDPNAKLSTAVEKVDAQFTAEAAMGGMAEIELGKLARKKGNNRRIKNFGTMMIMDHSKINNTIKALAITKNILLPAAPDADEQKAISLLSKRSGKDFDEAYIDNMIYDHEKDIKAFETAAKKCQDPDVKSFAAKTLPVLQAHLDAINAIKYSMK